MDVSSFSQGDLPLSLPSCQRVCSVPNQSLGSGSQCFLYYQASNLGQRGDSNVQALEHAEQSRSVRAQARLAGIQVRRGLAWALIRGLTTRYVLSSSSSLLLPLAQPQAVLAQRAPD